MIYIKTVTRVTKYLKHYKIILFFKIYIKKLKRSILLGVQEVAGSNPVTPTIETGGLYEVYNPLILIFCT